MIVDQGLLIEAADINKNSPLFGWDNIVTTGNVAAESEDPNFPATNLANPATDLKWAGASAAAQNLVVTTPDDDYGPAIDYVGLARHNFWTAGIQVAVDGVENNESDLTQKVLLHFDGADASTVITDSNVGGSAHTWTAVGGAELDTADKKYGTAALFLDGTNNYVTTPDHADFTLGAGDFTVDMWFKCNVAGGTVERLAGHCDSVPNVSTTAWRIRRTVGNVLEALVAVGASSFVVTGTTQFTNAVNTGWHHCALVRTGSVLKLFIDGVQEGGDVAIAGTVNNSSDVLGVGTNGAVTSDSWTGWIDEFRLTVGKAKWTSNFSPPGPHDQYDWVELAPEHAPDDDRVILFRFTPTVLSRIRLRLSAGSEVPELAVLHVGKLLYSQRRVYVGHSPINLARRDKGEALQSESGEFLGRNVVGGSIQTTLALQNLTPDWVRAELDPFLLNSRSLPFFFAWRPERYPDELAYCWMIGTPVPQNQRANGRMSIDMQIGGLLE